jgi:superfamily II DNA or RNA helicase
MSELASRCWHLEEEGVLFRFNTGGEPVRFPLAVSGANQSIPAPLIAAVALIDELVLDEVLTVTPDGCMLEYDALYQIDVEGRATLGLPAEDKQLQARLQTRGVPSNPSFQMRLEVVHPSHGRLEGLVERRGGIYVLNDEEVVMVPESVYRLMKVIDDGIPPDEENPTHARMILQERAKRRAALAEVKLEGFVGNETFVLPEDSSVSVSIDVESPQELRLHPEIISPATQAEALGQLNEVVRKGVSASGVVSSPTAGGQRIRAILDEDRQETVRQVERSGEISGADVPRFLDNPETYLPEGIDLTDFSDRVTGIAIERATVRPVMHLEQKANGLIDFRANVHLEPVGLCGDEVDVAELGGVELQGLIERANDAGEEYVFHRNKWVHIDVASLESFQEAVKTAQDRYGGRGVAGTDLRGFLEIFTNIEDLEYGRSIALIKQILENQDVDAGPRYPLPANLILELFPHQKEGYAWLRFLEEHRWGGLLADDMGLGKTIQAISLMAALKETDGVSPSLLIVPTSVSRNWQREIMAACPSLSVYEHLGASRVKNGEQLKSIAVGVDVVLTSYQTMRRDQLTLGRIDWQLIILDEAQNIKNPNTGVSMASKAFKSMKGRLALTGTPVENGLSELWSIYDFVQPGHLGSYKQFRSEFEVPLHSDDETAAEAASESLRGRIQDLYMRRLRGEVLEGLPPLVEQRQCVELGDSQLAQYLTLVEAARNAGRGQVLGYLVRLLQVSSHPALVREGGRADLPTELEDECPKLGETMAILKTVRDAGEKALIFTEYKKMQEILMGCIYHHYGFWAGRINGDVDGNSRQLIVDRFNASEQFDVLVLSPTAGGVGLNITGANHVIHYTRLWNPAKEMQATARAHRIKQTKTVNVYYPVVEHPEFETIEVRLDRLLKRKSKLAQDVIRPSKGLDITIDELQDLIGEEVAVAQGNE